MKTAMDVIRTVAVDFGTTPDVLRSKHLNRKFGEARTRAYRLLKEECGLSYSQIGLLMGRHRSTIAQMMNPQWGISKRVERSLKRQRRSERDIEKMRSYKRQWNKSLSGLISKAKYWRSLCDYEERNGNQVPATYRINARYYEKRAAAVSPS